MIELEHVLEPHRDLIEEWLRPAIWIYADEESTGALGQSRLAGTPDLPTSIAWPSFRGTLLGYMLQINLAELPQDAAMPSLPTSGMLWLYESWTTYTHDQLEVYTGDEPLVSSDLLIESYYSETVKPHTLRFRSGHDLPRWSSDAEESLNNELAKRLSLEDPFDAYELLEPLRDTLSDGAFAKFFGWTGGVGKDIHEDAFFHRHHPGVDDWRERKAIDSTAKSAWRNLLTVHSSSSLNLCIGDAVSTAVLIHGDDLAVHDFSRCFVTQKSA